MTEAAKRKGQQQVSEFLNRLDHPLKMEILALRSLILGANNKLTEQIKWNAPSFCSNGVDRITFNLQGKGTLRLIFHCGAKATPGTKPSTPLFTDTTGLLRWVAKDRAVAEFAGMSDIKSNEAAIADIVRQWIVAADAIS